jgi:leader peptidase (prepilin peptidase)/N-methyltransferase
LPTEWLSLETWRHVGLWTLAGALLGMGLERIVLALPVWVLAPYGDQVQAEDWQGPGGGLFSKPHPVRWMALACLNALIWTACALWSPPAAQGLTLGVWAWAVCGTAFLVLAAVDWNTTLLPDVLVWPLVWAGLLASERHWTAVPLAVSLWSVVLWYLAMQALAWGFERVTGRTGMGEGDAKLLAAMAAWWGWQPTLWALLWGALLTLLVGLVWRRRGLAPWAHVPFGPFLVVGLVCWTVAGWPV